ncbi:hypothetical protein [Azospirillum oleiclasticum]|jgi:hypothetical protein|nr:hypothetical protein [Azospirillum oleiclasticum]
MVDFSKKLVLVFMTALGLVGVYVASSNLPVATGCRYYADCAVTE